MRNELKGKQKVFVAEYLKDLNATQAAIRAGYSAKTAIQQGSALLTKLDVKTAIEKAQAERAEAAKLKAANVIDELACMAFYDPADIGSCEINCPADIAKLPEKIRRAIIGWSWDRNQNFTLKLAPKTPNLELIGRHLGMFVDRVKHEGDRLVLIVEGGPQSNESESVQKV
ncbi:MAG: terminase small subunit [Candidatus Riflebacteria bacterium]|nr:terminase small subunit [Candidatus Riflebacteria bacterium]